MFALHREPALQEVPGKSSTELSFSLNGGMPVISKGVMVGMEPSLEPFNHTDCHAFLSVLPVGRNRRKELSIYKEAHLSLHFMQTVAS